MIDVTFKDLDVLPALEQLRQIKARRVDRVVPFKPNRITMADDGRLWVAEATRMLEAGKASAVNVAARDFWVSLSPLAHQQLAARLGIDKRYYDKMQAIVPALLAQNVNGWIRYECDRAEAEAAATPSKGPQQMELIRTPHAGRPKYKQLLLRMLTDEPGGARGTLQAVLSDRYFIIDNLPLLELAMEEVKRANEQEGMDIIIDKASLTEEKMYVRFVSRSLRAQLPEALRNYRRPGSGRGTGVGDGIVGGFVISNSEVGLGNAMAAPFCMFLACMNGAIWHDEGYKRMHLGARLEEGAIEWSNRTKEANVELVRQQLRDAIAHFCTPEFMGQRVADLEEMAARKLEYPTQAVQNICRSIGMTDEERVDVLNYFALQGSADSLLDVVHAVTYHAQQVGEDKRYKYESAATTLMGVVDKCDQPELIKVKSN